MSKQAYLSEQLAKGGSPLDVRDAILEASLPGNVKAVLGAIYSHRGKDEKARVGVRRLAFLASINKDTAAKVARKCVELGLITSMPGPRSDDPVTYDLACLPAALLKLLEVSETEGHHVSESKGHRCPKPRDTINDTTKESGVRNERTPCPNPRDAVVSETEGQKQGDLKLEEKREFAQPPATQEPGVLFALEPESVKPKRAKKPAKPKLDHPAHSQVKAHYESEFQRIRGYDATWGPAQGKATNDLIHKLKGDVPECCRRITNGLESWDKATILSIAGDPDKCVKASLPKYTPRKPVERQQGDNPDVKVNSGKWAPKPLLQVVGGVA